MSPEEFDQRIVEAIHMALQLHKPPMSELLTLQQVAEKLSLSTRSVYRLIRDGHRSKTGKLIRLPVHEIIKGRYLIQSEALNQWVANF